MSTTKIKTSNVSDGASTHVKLAPEAAFPSQAGEEGKVLLSDGTTANWEVFDADPAGTSVAMAIALG